MIDSLCILGGGTSGLVSALMIKKAWPTIDITVVESSKYGIVGVGEGSTEHWKKFMEHIEINVPDLIRETGATYKMGIKFTNWHGDGTHYFHSLSEQFSSFSKENGLPYTWIYMIGENYDPLDTCWSLSRNSRHVEPLHDILSQYHFDTHKLNLYLHKLCHERNIKFVDTEIEDVIIDNVGYVKALLDKDKRLHEADFFIDCSGFRRVIGSKLGAKWIECSAELPMNAAIAFPTGYTEEIPSYTESTALGSGWVWRIPTQERYGNGYVFCDNFINETQAYDEVSNYYNNNLNIDQKIEVGKTFKFNAGYVEKFWIKNCVMMGLSGIFVEPLEASSIGTTIQQTFLLLPSIFFYERNDELTIKRYNDMLLGISKNIVDFIQLHYFTQRQDTEFWKWAKHNIKMTEFNKMYLNYFKEQGVNVYYFNHSERLFSHLNYAQVMLGLRMFNNENIKQKYEKHLSKYKDTSLSIIQESKNIENLPIETFSHREAINILKERYERVEYKF